MLEKCRKGIQSIFLIGRDSVSSISDCHRISKNSFKSSQLRFSGHSSSSMHQSIRSVSNQITQPLRSHGIASTAVSNSGIRYTECSVSENSYEFNSAQYQRTRPTGGAKTHPNSIDSIISPSQGMEALGNYPNPIFSETTFTFSVENSGEYSFEISNVFGEKIKTIFLNKQFEKGFHSVVENLSSLENGSYLYTLIGENQRITKKFVKMNR